MSLLSKINSPRDLKQLSLEDLNEFGKLFFSFKTVALREAIWRKFRL